MGTGQPPWSVDSQPARLTTAILGDAQNQSAPSVDMDFTSFLDSVNQNEQNNMNAIDAYEFQTNQTCWGPNQPMSNGHTSTHVSKAEDPSSESRPVPIPIEGVPTFSDMTFHSDAPEMIRGSLEGLDAVSHPPPYQHLFANSKLPFGMEFSWPVMTPQQAFLPELGYSQQSQLQLHPQSPSHEIDGSWIRSSYSPALGEFESHEEDEISDTSDPCYAQLLFRCLKEAPNHTMALKELYDWVAQNSKKANDATSKGWQNSVRHNLSMNKAFERVAQTDNHGQKRGSLWRVTEKALREGVISTTRFRKDPKRKLERRSSPAPKRQASGAKGGQATRRAANARSQKQPKPRDTLGPVTVDDVHQLTSAYHMLGPQELSHAHPQATGNSMPERYWTPQSRFTSSPQASPYFNGNAGRPGDLEMSGSPAFSQQICIGDTRQPCLSQYNYQHLDLERGGLFGDEDDAPAETPSLGSDISMPTDDGMLTMSHY